MDAGNPEWLDQDEQGEDGEEVPEDGEEAAPRDSHVFFTTVRCGSSARVCVCACVRVRVCACGRLCVCASVRVGVCASVCLCVSACVRICVCSGACTWASVPHVGRLSQTSACVRERSVGGVMWGAAEPACLHHVGQHPPPHITLSLNPP